MTEDTPKNDLVATSPQQPKKSNVWIILGMCAGLSFGLGNTIFGLHCSKRGVWGGGFTGPMPFLLLVIYRLGQACFSIKPKSGSFVDKANSNYWKLTAATSINNEDDFQNQ